MEKNLLLDALIKDMLGEGQQLSISEIQEEAQRKLVKEDYNAKQIYNFIYNMKGRGEIQRTSDGKYYLKDFLIEANNADNCDGVFGMTLEEYADFEVVDPSTTRIRKEVLSVMGSGTVGVNSALLKHFDNFNAEIRLKKDCTEIIMLKYGKVMTNLGKQGRVKNYNLVEKLKKANMKLPIYFVGEWDEEKAVWHGKLFPYHPNKGRREKQK